MFYHKNKKLIIFTIIISVLFTFFVNLNVIFAGDYGLKATIGETDNALIDPAKRPIPVIIGDIIGAVLAFIGVLFLILTIYGGITWMTAQGNEQQVEKAKQIIIAAVIGLIIVLSAYAITAFVGQALLVGV